MRSKYVNRSLRTLSWWLLQITLLAICRIKFYIDKVCVTRGFLHKINSLHWLSASIHLHNSNRIFFIKCSFHDLKSLMVCHWHNALVNKKKTVWFARVSHIIAQWRHHRIHASTDLLIRCQRVSRVKAISQEEMCHILA